MENGAQADTSSQKQANIQALVEMGVTVKGRVDATNLRETVGGKFDSIIWNFPHTGTGPRPKIAANHRRLLNKFFASAREVITLNGKVYVTMKKTRYYKSWRIEEQANDQGFELAGSTVKEIEDFQRAYPGYTPIMTKSGQPIPNLKETITYQFKLKG